MVEMQSPESQPPLRNRCILADQLDRVPLLLVIGLIIFVPVVAEIALDYYSGLTWRTPAYYIIVPFFLLANCVAFVALVACWKRNTIKYVAILLLGVPLHFFLAGEIYRRERPFLNGLSKAAQRADLEPIRQWALSHQPPKDEAVGLHYEVNLPEAIRQLLPYKDGAYLQFRRFSLDGDWMLTIDHSGGFVHHNGVILTLGATADPRAGWFMRPRQVAPNFWVFDGG